MEKVADILEAIRTYSPDANLQPVMTAYLMAARAHAGQTRKSGEPYLSHPMAVAMILTDMRMDVDTIATALLHDALEDNPITKEEMANEIGPVITNLVDGVTKIGKLKFRSREELAAENFRKMMLAMSQDVRVILVKLADRLHNMSTLEFHKPEKRVAIATETLDIFVPIANRLGLESIKAKLENFCFKAIEPEIFDEIEAFLTQSQGDREEYTARVVSSLEQHFSEVGVDCRVYGRAKQPSSIHQKMKSQGLALHEVADLIAFRVIVQDVASCYAALGFVHSSFPPVPQRIKDYIARPKPNGYQSIHTTVIGPEERRIEVQIRTEEMNRFAEEGIAAHWRYKEGHLALTPEDVLKISKIRDLFETAKDAEDASDFMQDVKSEFYADEVFCFTPQGDVRRFPKGSTTLDFAYAIHTDVGNTCTGARVHARMVPLRYELVSGDVVEIITSPNQQPNRDWLQIAKTGRAIQKIRRHLRLLEREQGVRLGRDMIEAELKRVGWTLAKVKSEGLLKVSLKRGGYKEVEALYLDIARGQQALAGAVRDLLPDGVYESKQEAAQKGALQSLFNRFRQRSESPVLISGEDGMLVTYAKCCAPLPGESVVGFITRGRGITIHRDTCGQLKSMDLERRIAVQWAGNEDAKHSGEIEIYCDHRPGMLANITKVCEKAKVNIQRVEAKGLRDNKAVCTLQLAVRDVGELSRLIRFIEQIKGVDSVHRMVG